jgi:hypothetical protein
VLDRSWFRVGIDPLDLHPQGFRAGGGGAHQSKTMMLVELEALLAAGPVDAATRQRLIMDENILGKGSAAAKQSVLRQISNLYDLGGSGPVAKGLVALWPIDREARPLLALLCALARDPLLRDSAAPILTVPVGAQVGRTEIAAALTEAHPNRFSPAMLKSLAQNCASSWTQSGHLTGRRNKRRARAQVTPVAAAYAALLASLAGFGGPALIASPWMDVLDISANERLALLRRAEAQGLLRVRAAGDVVEVLLDPLLARIGGGAEAAHV